jgi:hypothetical protein
VALCSVLGVLPACSTLRLGYSTAPTLAYWWLDRYVNFNDDQQPAVRSALNQWFAWHKSTQLADYATLLARMKIEAASNTTPERACAWQTQWSQRLQTAINQALPAAAALAPTLTPEQFQQMKSRYATVNQEFRDEYLQADLAQRAQANLKRTVERVEMLYGTLNDAQIEALKTLLARSPFDPDVWLAERQQRQQDLLQLLTRLNEQRAKAPQITAALRTYAEQVAQSPREPYRRYAQRLNEFNCAFIASVHNATTPAQRVVAAQKLAGWEGDLRALAINPAKPAVETAPQ